MISILGRSTTGVENEGESGAISSCETPSFKLKDARFPNSNPPKFGFSLDSVIILLALKLWVRSSIDNFAASK